MIKRLPMLVAIGLMLAPTPALATPFRNELTLENMGRLSLPSMSIPPGYGAKLELALGESPLSVGALYQTSGELGKAPYAPRIQSAWASMSLLGDEAVILKLIAGVNHYVPMDQASPPQAGGGTNSPSAFVGPFVGLSLEGRWHMLWGRLSPTYAFMSNLPTGESGWLTSGLPIAQVGISLWDRVDLGVQLAMVPVMARLRF